MAPRPRPAAALAALGLAGALLGACDTPATRAGPPPPQFYVDGVLLTASSGAAVPTATGYALYISDHADTCTDVMAVPQQTLTLLTLKVTPAGGTNAATVGAPIDALPAAGQGYGELTVTTKGVANVTPKDTSDGSISWSVGSDGSVTIEAMDLGFAGTTDRIQASGLFLRHCP